MKRFKSAVRAFSGANRDTQLAVSALLFGFAIPLILTIAANEVRVLN